MLYISDQYSASPAERRKILSWLKAAEPAMQHKRFSVLAKNGETYLVVTDRQKSSGTQLSTNKARVARLLEISEDGVQWMTHRHTNYPTFGTYVGHNSVLVNVPPTKSMSGHLDIYVHGKKQDSLVYKNDLGIYVRGAGDVSLLLVDEITSQSLDLHQFDCSLVKDAVLLLPQSKFQVPEPQTITTTAQSLARTEFSALGAAKLQMFDVVQDSFQQVGRLRKVVKPTRLLEDASDYYHAIRRSVCRTLPAVSKISQDFVVETATAAVYASEKGVWVQTADGQRLTPIFKRLQPLFVRRNDCFQVSHVFGSFRKSGKYDFLRLAEGGVKPKILSGNPAKANFSQHSAQLVAMAAKNTETQYAVVDVGPEKTRYSTKGRRYQVVDLQEDHVVFEVTTVPMLIFKTASDLMLLGLESFNRAELWSQNRGRIETGVCSVLVSEEPMVFSSELTYRELSQAKPEVSRMLVDDNYTVHSLKGVTQAALQSAAPSQAFQQVLSILQTVYPLRIESKELLAAIESLQRTYSFQQSLQRLEDVLEKATSPDLICKAIQTEVGLELFVQSPFPMSMLEKLGSGLQASARSAHIL